MTFLSLLAALLLEQASPLREDNRLLLWFKRYALALEDRLNGGQYRHGVIAWALAVAPALVVAAMVQLVLYDVSPLAGMLWSIAVLYLTMGFRRFSRFFTEVQLALHAGDLAAARDWLVKWRGISAAEFSAGEASRVAIEQGLLASHRHVFGTIAWFVALGPAGAILYRAAAVLSELWGARSEPDFGAFGRFAARAQTWLDWVPVRLTAATFAAVGDFADAVYCWRAQAAAWIPQADGIILASGGGALGVRLGDTLHQHGGLQYRPQLGTGEEADAGHMQQALGLVWRALVLCMFLLLLVSIAHSLG
jgi:adenosylcobinamide-phosphate synthase